MNEPVKTILFCGFGRSGKDEAASFLGRITTLRYAGSFSWAGLPYMAHLLGMHPCEAWEKRHQMRDVWKRELDHLRTLDQCCLARMVLQTGEIAAGLRDKVEIDAVKSEKLFDRIIWIHRPGTPVDPTVTYGPEDCDEQLCNDGTLEWFHYQLFEWAKANGLTFKDNAEYQKISSLNKPWFFAHDLPNGAFATKDSFTPLNVGPSPARVPFIPVIVKPFQVGNE
jgi:hypothetical protein